MPTASVVTVSSADDRSCMIEYFPVDVIVAVGADQFVARVICRAYGFERLRKDEGMRGLARAGAKLEGSFAVHAYEVGHFCSVAQLVFEQLLFLAPIRAEAA